MVETRSLEGSAVKAIEALGNQLCPAEFLARCPEWVGGNISQYDSRFLAGLANLGDVKSVAEIGVASGWSSAVLLKALDTLPGNRKVTGIDLSEHFYLDKNIPTGRAVEEVVPERLESYDLKTGRLAFDVMDEVGAIDFAFIDGHHMHPWATLDMLSLLPHISRQCWVAMHDLNLCTIERHKHMNRGPFYLFYMWPDHKLHSTQEPTMIGAVLLEREPQDYLPLLLELLYTPWEVNVDDATLDRLAGYIGRHFGDEWGLSFSSVFNDKRIRPGAN